MRIFAGRIGLLFLGTCVSVAPAWANLSLPIVNPSFETLPSGGLTVTAGCGAVSGCAYSLGQIPGWNVTNPSDTGQWQPGVLGAPPSFFSTLPNGPTIAFSNGGEIFQSVGKVTAGEVGNTLTLGVYVGNRSDGASVSSYLGKVDLMIGGTSFFATGIAPLSGNWSLWTVSVPIVSSQVGKGITVMLINPSSVAQVDFDDVNLSETPESGFYGLLALGLTGLAFFVRRRPSAAVHTSL